MNKINEDQDVCVVCGSIELLDDMWVMVRTPKAVANFVIVVMVLVRGVRKILVF